MSVEKHVGGLGYRYERIMMQREDLQRKVHETYKSAFVRKYHRQPTENDRNTVLAAFVLEDRVTGELVVASLATGTKSLPIQLLEHHDRQLLRDMHAEVLARRAFLRLLIDSVGRLQKQPETPQFLPQLFTKDEKRSKLRLNSNRYKLILYTTELPCGSCTIDRENSLFSGAKPLSAFGEAAYQHGEQVQYDRLVLRTKPGRLDLPLSRRSCSLSCTDKLMMWSLLGLQGKKLFGFILPVYIDEIVIEMSEPVNALNLRQALDVRFRLSRLLHKKQSTIERKLFNVIIEEKERPFTKQFRVHIPAVSTVQKSFKPLGDLLKKTDSSLIVDYLGAVEECNGHTGIKHGCSVKQLAKGLSLYSSCKLLDEIEIDTARHYQYAALKKRVKGLFGEWTDPHKPWRHPTIPPKGENKEKINTVTGDSDPQFTTGSFQN